VKLYSNILTAADLGAALPDGVSIEVVALRSPRISSRGWHVSLSYLAGTRHKNSGKHGAKTWDDPAASWDQHGQWMARLYERDPDMRVAHYNNAEDFHRKTGNKYAEAVAA
jgi:hypothetical protein